MNDQRLSQPPSGDDDQGWAILSVCWALVTAALVSTILRIWIRVRLTHNLSWDDGIMAIAMTTTIMGASFVTAEVFNGLGRHEYYLEPSQRRNYQALAWADWVQVFITLLLTKISICLFLLRIVNSSKVTRFMYGLIGFMVLFTAVCVFLFLGICRPLKAYWDVGVQGTCLSDRQVESIVIAQGVLSIITDLICAALPAIFLRNLQRSLKAKIGLCTLMGLGVVTAICCIVRTSLSPAIRNPDHTWAISANVGWRLPEVNIGILCANAPVFRTLYLYFQGKSQIQRLASPSPGVGKERVWPSNARLADRTLLQESSQSHNENRDVSVSLEMGINTN